MNPVSWNAKFHNSGGSSPYIHIETRERGQKLSNPRQEADYRVHRTGPPYPLFLRVFLAVRNCFLRDRLRRRVSCGPYSANVFLRLGMMKKYISRNKKSILL